ncbi:MAG: DUF177 domain-containing protein [Pyrinomonadaceae bacterium]
MKIDLKEFEDLSIDFAVDIEEAEVDLNECQARVDGAGKFIGKVEKNDWLVTIEGRLAAPYFRKCGRCLEEIGGEVSANFVGAYVFFGDITEERESELEKFESDYFVLESRELDLRQVFGEAVLTMLDATFVCSEDCEGLCQKCGANLNLSDCGCGEEFADPRWAALKGLKGS